MGGTLWPQAIAIDPWLLTNINQNVLWQPLLFFGYGEISPASLDSFLICLLVFCPLSTNDSIYGQTCWLGGTGLFINMVENEEVFKLPFTSLF